jgi:myo-inositol-1(or 4)-monophosphatase
VRRDGSAALDFCYTAMGRFDGFWEMNLSAWDMAAGSLIVEEAGGKITDLKGNNFSIYNKNVVASNSLIHKAMIDVIAEKG